MNRTSCMVTRYTNDERSGDFKTFDTREEAVQWVFDNAHPDDRFYTLSVFGPHDIEHERWTIDESGKPEHQCTTVELL